MATTEIDSDELYALQDQAASALPWQNMAIRLGVELHNYDPNNMLLKDDILRPEVEKVLDELEQREHDAAATSGIARETQNLSPNRALVADEEDENAPNALEPEDIQ